MLSVCFNNVILHKRIKIKVTFKAIASGVTRTLAWVWHHCVWVTALALLLVAASVMALRYWVLPNVDQYNERIAGEVSKAAGQKVIIGRITADWDGLHPRLNLNDVIVHDKSGQPALTLKRVDSTLSWLSVPLMRPHFRALDFYEPQLSVRRDKAGHILVGGIDTADESGEGGLSDWVLAQRDIEIHDATIAWSDELRGAPVLLLTKVGLQLVNNGERHRFGLRATPPKELASTLDVRGDLHGKSAKNLADWVGRIYANFDHTDIAAWRAWVSFPFELTRGTGGLRAWVSLRNEAVRELTADVKLAHVRTRLGRELPELDLTALEGRFIWKRDVKSLDFTASRLALTTAGNLRLQPMDLQYKATLNEKAEHLSGSLKATTLDIAAVSSLTEHLPIAQEARKVLAEFAPQGTLHDLTAEWQGPLPRPAQYRARARFENFAFKRRGAAPGLTGLTGAVDASEKNGKLELKSGAVRLDMPELFKTALDFNSLGANVNWSVDSKGLQIKLGNIAFANADLEGTLAGTYQSAPTGTTGTRRPGIADIAGKFTRADARQLMRYMPITVATGARPWMDAALLAGSSNDVQFKVKGDLYEFPFIGDRNGQFLVTARVSGGKLHYGDGWPDIDRIDGDLKFRGSRMEVDARQGYIDGVKLSGVKAEIADMSMSRLLVVTGDADGSTPDFFKFIAASPVTGYINRFTETMQGEGPGRLRMRLDLPLRDLKQTKVAGAYNVTNNRLLLDPAVPPFEQVTGRLEFDETGFNVPQATATFFGGPMSVNGAMQRDGSIRMNLSGHVNPDTMRRAGGPQWLTHVRGASDWRGAVTVRNKTMDLTVESTLQGIAINLPAPLGKAAGDALPIKLERRFLASDRDQFNLHVGELLNAKLHRHSEGKRTIIDRGTVRLGSGDAAEPTGAGVLVSGAMKSLDADAWLKFLGSPGAANTGDASDVQWTLAGLDVKLGELEFYDRHFNEITIKHNGVRSGNAHYVIGGREIDGTVDWNGQLRRLAANLKTLTIPAPRPGTQAAPVEKPTDQDSSQFPSLDITVENFTLLGKSLGKLELQAAPKERDWHLSKLWLTQANESYLRMDGVWQSWLSSPRTQLNIDWKVQDIGKTLTRLGYVDGVRRGTAEIGGTLAWTGGPQAIDYATLSGKLTLRAVNGQFARMEPGIGRLLGVLSLQSLPRRLSLDFRDIFSDGLAFDEILSDVKVERGVAMSDRFFISSPSARIVMSGAVDLNRETQNLQVRVNPRISDSAAIVTAIFLPLPALVAYVASKISKDPLDGLFAFRYTVTGTWADPIVTSVSQPPPQAPTPEAPSGTE